MEARGFESCLCYCTEKIFKLQVSIFIVGGKGPEIDSIVLASFLPLSHLHLSFFLFSDPSFVISFLFGVGL